MQTVFICGETWKTRAERTWEDNNKYLKNTVVRHGLDSSGFVQESLVGCCEHGNEPSGTLSAKNLLTS